MVELSRATDEDMPTARGAVRGDRREEGDILRGAPEAARGSQGDWVVLFLTKRDFAVALSMSSKWQWGLDALI